MIQFGKYNQGEEGWLFIYKKHINIILRLPWQRSEPRATITSQ